ncbi:hypothetical protein ACOHYD_07805 [Desulfobacterota bacterium M19]
MNGRADMEEEKFKRLVETGICYRYPSQPAVIYKKSVLKNKKL